MVKMKKTRIYWNKMTIAGFAVLELSKLLMYKFHYDKIVQRYGFNAKLLITDTDSLAYEIKTNNVYEDMLKNPRDFDTSDYAKEHPNYSEIGRKQIGLMKDECNGVPPIEFVGLRSKMYSLLLPNKSKAVAKGVQRAYAKKYLKHALYRECLMNETLSSASFYSIVSKNHRLQTRKIIKDSLSPYDDKRFLLSNDYNTLAYGHFRIKNILKDEATVIANKTAVETVASN